MTIFSVLIHSNTHILYYRVDFVHHTVFYGLILMIVYIPTELHSAKASLELLKEVQRELLVEDPPPKIALAILIEPTGIKNV